MAQKDDKKKQKLGHVILNDSEGSAKDNGRTLHGAQPDTTEVLQQQIGELTEALQRERADIMNIRRRHDEQMANLRTTLKAHVIKDLLPVIDNFERALKHVPAELVDNDYIKGVQAVVKQFEKTLADMGVERIATVGQPFDPHLHEAVSMEEGDGDQEIVTEELQSGYKVGDEVIRHAMVRVKG
jgi:molecular chaperone GrpE